MKTRIISAAVLIPVMIVLLYFAPPLVFTLAVAIVCVIAASELMRAFDARRVEAIPMASAALVPVCSYFFAGRGFIMPILIVLAAVVFVIAVFSYGRKSALRFEQIAASIFGGVLIPWLLSVLIAIKTGENGKLLVFVPFVLTILSDSAAYFTGRYLGRHAGVLPVSPRKTAEGFVGSLAGAFLAMYLCGLLFSAVWHIEVDFARLAVYAVAGNIAAQLGDLAFSLIKREKGIKDYGKLIPGHGGALDRFDSIIFAAPVIYMLLVFFPAF